MPLLDTITKVFSGSAGQVIENIANAADKFITTGAEKEEFKLKVQQELNARDQAVRESLTKEMELQLKDVADARSMNIKVQESESASWLSKNIAPMLSIVILFATFSLWGIILLGRIDLEEKKEIAFTVLGTLSTLSVTIAAYYFGSSAGSKRNADSIRNIAEKNS